MDYRSLGKEALKTVLNQDQNIRIIEKNIYITSVKTAKDKENIEKTYKDNIYQTIYDISNNKKLKDILDCIKNQKVGWQHPTFKDMKNRIEEQNNFIKNPFEVVEGVQQCKAINKSTGKVCNSKRVFYYSKQERGSDEPMTTYNTCCACGAKWKYSG